MALLARAKAYVSYSVQDLKNQARLHVPHLQFVDREVPRIAVGVEDTAIRLAVVRPPSTPNEKETIESREAMLPEGTVRDGALVNTDAFRSALASLVRSGDTPYVVLTLPSSGVYAKILEFPNNLSAERIHEAIELGADYQLPFSKDTAYWDSELLGTEHPSALVAGIRRDSVDPYLAAFRDVGMMPIVVEWRGRSILRTLAPTPEPFVLSFTAEQSLRQYVIHNEKLTFMRSLPLAHVSDPMHEAELLAEYYGSEKNVDVKILTLETAPVTTRAAALLGNHDRTWLTLVGAAIRGAYKRKDDAEISLLAVGAEEAYAYQKAYRFMKFVSILVSGISLFFVVAFFSAWLLMLSLENAANVRARIASTPVASPDVIANKDSALALQDFVNSGAAILSESPRWSSLVDLVAEKTDSPNIIVTSFSFPGLMGQMTIAGLAKTRNDLNGLKKTLQETKEFRDVNLPLTNLEQKENIPFSITFYLRNPETLLYH